MKVKKHEINPNSYKHEKKYQMLARFDALETEVFEDFQEIYSKGLLHFIFIIFSIPQITGSYSTILVGIGALCIRIYLAKYHHNAMIVATTLSNHNERCALLHRPVYEVEEMISFRQAEAICSTSAVDYLYKHKQILRWNYTVTFIAELLFYVTCTITNLFM